MNSLNYFLASIICFSGLFLGRILIRISPEEQRPLDRYFVFAKRTIIFLIFFFVGFYYLYDLGILIFLAVLYAIMIISDYKISELRKKSIIDYSIMAIVFFLSFKNQNLFAIETSLIMILGIPFAPIMYKKEKNAKFMFYSFIFVALSNLLLLLSPFFISYF